MGSSRANRVVPSFFATAPKNTCLGASLGPYTRRFIQELPERQLRTRLEDFRLLVLLGSKPRGLVIHNQSPRASQPGCHRRNRTQNRAESKARLAAAKQDLGRTLRMVWPAELVVSPRPRALDNRPEIKAKKNKLVFDTKRVTN